MWFNLSYINKVFCYETNTSRTWIYVFLEKIFNAFGLFCYAMLKKENILFRLHLGKDELFHAHTFVVFYKLW